MISLSTPAVGGVSRADIAFMDLKKAFDLGTEIPPNIVIGGYTLEVVENFTYLGSTISSSLSIDSEINGSLRRPDCVSTKPAFSAPSSMEVETSTHARRVTPEAHTADQVARPSPRR
ncbi:hypothetical protein RRG08_055091 [Elysia crispata]|uniref:Uncharacterized protein n=1 Tax=Elysia crispata TaxID=231223 RepID=A0AAE1DS43_9GAST|nr:hypothetical protein RRG08_055091 [Elysia crispata]